MGFDRASGRKAGLDQKKTNSSNYSSNLHQSLWTNTSGELPFSRKKNRWRCVNSLETTRSIPPSRSGTTCSWTLHAACLGSPFEMMSAAIFSGPVTCPWTALSEWNQGVGRVDNPERIWTGKALACTFWHSDTSPESKHDILTMWPHRRKSSAHALHKVHA